MEKTFVLLIMTLYFEIVLPKSRLDVSENFWKTRGDEFNAGQSLTACHRNNRDQMEKCIDEAFDNWMYYEKLDPRVYSEWQSIKSACCAMWDARDCQIKLAKYYCDENDQHEIHQSWESGIAMWDRVNQCDYNKYSYGSAKCKLADWAIALIVVGCVLVVAVGVVLVIRCQRRRKMKRILKYEDC